MYSFYRVGYLNYVNENYRFHYEAEVESLKSMPVLGVRLGWQVCRCRFLALSRDGRSADAGSWMAVLGVDLVELLPDLLRGASQPQLLNLLQVWLGVGVALERELPEGGQVPAVAVHQEQLPRALGPRVHARV